MQVDDQGGREERFYGKLGEVVKEIKTIASDTQGNRSDQAAAHARNLEKNPHYATSGTGGGAGGNNRS